MISGCCEGDCHFRLGNTWMDQRFKEERMPILRTRVPRKLVRTRWLGVQGKAKLDQEIVEFQHYLRHDAEAEEQAMSHG
jgi:coenzyme F420-reducing hydrogenase delta subunit